jgi:hypothetical protein
VRPRVAPRYALCRGPFDLPDEGYFIVEVEPRKLVGRSIRFPMSDSCFWRTYPVHRLAWAVGYRVLRAVSDLGFRSPPGHSSTPIEIDRIQTGPMSNTQEIDDAIMEAPLRTRASQAVRCPACSKVIPLGGGWLEMDGVPPFGHGQVVSVRCSCRRKIVVTSEELHFYIEPVDSPLERELKTG